jgi:cell division protein FtsQ
MVKKILSIVLWVVTAAALIILFVFAREDYLNRPLKSVQLITETDTGFVRKGEVREELWQMCSNKKIGTVNMTALKKSLDHNPWIESNASYIDLDGTLKVSYEEHQPKFRVFGKNGRSVYVTDNAVVIPTSRLYTPYVMVVSGNFDIDNDTSAYALNDSLDTHRNLIDALTWFKAIEANDFISNCVGQVYCSPKNEFELTVRGIDARIIVGDTCLAADKLKRLELFMKQRLDSPEVKSMKIINLNYKNQIVCTKR